MLTRNDIATVKATAPAVAENAFAITTAFYDRMFRENPEVRRFFNMAHQIDEGQPRALAGAICAYAASIDNPAALVAAVELIAQKHCSLEVQADQYPIVGRNLLAAIGEVLGKAATEEILGAWERAYGVLADILITRERQIYEEQVSNEGGWNGRRAFVVKRKAAESEIITSFYLVPRDGGLLPAFQPGQYITVFADHLATDVAEPISPRNYSLSQGPGRETLRISVKREASPDAGAPDGVVSCLLHDHLQGGDVIHLGPPCGEFVLKPEPGRPVVLLSGGVGVTPLIPMLEALAKSSVDVPVLFAHGARNGRFHAFREEVAALAAQRTNIRTLTLYSEPEPGDVEEGRCDRVGFLDIEELKREFPEGEPDFYFCGPPAFMTGVHRDLKRLGVEASRLHFEFFGPLQELEATEEALA
jgi:nitric oxide dioxygenase